GVANAAVDQHRRRFLAARAGDGKGGNVAGLEAGELLDRPLNILRPMIAAVDDDHVLGPADNEDVAARHIAHVAGIEPTGLHAGLGRFRITEITVHDARPADPDLADRTIVERFAVGAADFDFHALDRLAAID